jgi:hypothetical protein
LPTHDSNECRNPSCEICRHNYDFDLPEPIVDALCKRDLVIFAGGGISTESHLARGRTLYEKIGYELARPDHDRPAFPELMARYAQANGRRQLLQFIKQHLEYGNLFSEVYIASTRFHRELATVPFLDQIYTTNWDDYFETVCYATPYVTADDFAFWDLPGRKVFKLHGSIHNIGSMVITTDDYTRCYKSLRDGVIGGFLKVALATKTIIFIGYSLTDSDFQRLWKLVHDDLGGNLPNAFWITLDTSPNLPKSLDGLQRIHTDATHFVRVLKSKLVERDIMIPDERWIQVRALNALFEIEQQKLLNKFPIKKYPETIYPVFYQDGVKHACDVLLSRALSGQSAHKCYIVDMIRTYEGHRKERLKNRNYGDVAYIEGFLNGLFFAVVDDNEREMIPRYFLFGRTGDLPSLGQYKKTRSHARELHKSSIDQAEKLLSTFNDGNYEVIHHRPYL